MRRERIEIPEPASARIRRSPDSEGDLCGAKAAAAIIGVERTRIARWQKRGMMPKPFAKLSSGPVWLRSEIEAFARERAEREAAAA